MLWYTFLEVGMSIRNSMVTLAVALIGTVMFAAACSDAGHMATAPGILCTTGTRAAPRILKDNE